MLPIVISHLSFCPFYHTKYPPDLILPTPTTSLTFMSYWVVSLSTSHFSLLVYLTISWSNALNSPTLLQTVYLNPELHLVLCGMTITKLSDPAFPWTSFSPTTQSSLGCFSTTDTSSKYMSTFKSFPRPLKAMSWLSQNFHQGPCPYTVTKDDKYTPHTAILFFNYKTLDYNGISKFKKIPTTNLLF